MSDIKSNVVLNFKSTGEVSFAQSLKEINSVMNAAAKEYKANIAAMGENASTAERLANEQKKLQTQLLAADHRVETLTEQFNKMKNSGEATTTQLNNMAGKLANAERVQTNLKNRLTEVNEALSKEGQESLNAKDKLASLASESQQLDAKEQQLTSAYKLQQAELGENASKSQRLASEQKSLGAILTTARDKVNSLERALKETKAAYGENSTEAMQMGTKLNNAKTNVAELETKMDSLGRESKTTSGALGSFKEKLSLGAVAGAASNAVQNVIGGLGDLISQGASASDAMQKFDSTMQFAGFGKSAIKTASASMKKYADDTVYDLDTVANTTAQLAANGVPHYTQLTQAAGNLNAVAGGNADTFNSVAMVLTQTAGAGKLTTENWNQLADAIPGASGKLQEALKKNGAYTGNFRDAMEKGQISAGEFNKAIMQLGMEDAAKKAAKSTSTFEGAIGNLQANIVDGIQKVIDSIGKANMTGLIDTISNGVVGAFKLVVNGLQEIKQHSTAFKILATSVVALVAAFKTMQIINTVTATIKTFADGIKLATAAQKAFDIVAAINPYTLIAVAIAGAIAAMTYFFTSTKKGQKMWSDFVTALKNMWNGLKTFFVNFWNSLKTTFNTAMQGISTLVKNIWNNIKTTTQNVWNSIKSVISSIWNGIKSTVSGAINGVKSTVSNVWNSIKSTTSSIWNGIKSVISNVWNAIKSVATSSVNAIKSVVSNVWNGIKSVTSSVWNAIKSVISGAINGAKSVVSGAVNAIRSTVSGVWNGIRSVTSSVWNGIKNAMVSPINAAKSVIAGIVRTIKGLFNIHLSFPAISIPHIPLPHFSLSGSFNPLKGKIPHVGVNWYAKGGIFDQPTLLPTAGGFNGVGDDGPEAALPLNAETLAGIGKGIAANMPTNNRALYLQVDGRTFAKLTAPYMSNAMGSNVKLNQFGMGGI
ncbi:MAG: tape measure protein [Liquorilactobacillus ghanensis]|uniref:tape measure protein n=1 Tax=Liquorilactobacillus ghanensis TaxID=399370 RepID=UPI0039EC8351